MRWKLVQHADRGSLEIWRLWHQDCSLDSYCVGNWYFLALVIQTHFSQDNFTNSHWTIPYLTETAFARDGETTTSVLLGAVISGSSQASADNFLPSLSLCGKSHFISFLNIQVYLFVLWSNFTSTFPMVCRTSTCGFLINFSSSSFKGPHSHLHQLCQSLGQRDVPLKPTLPLCQQHPLGYLGPQNSIQRAQVCFLLPKPMQVSWLNGHNFVVLFFVTTRGQHNHFVACGLLLKLEGGRWWTWELTTSRSLASKGWVVCRPKGTQLLEPTGPLLDHTCVSRTLEIPAQIAPSPFSGTMQTLTPVCPSECGLCFPSVHLGSTSGPKGWHL